MSTKWTYHKERSFASKYLIFWKFCFSLRTSYKDLIWWKGVLKLRNLVVRTLWRPEILSYALIEFGHHFVQYGFLRKSAIFAYRVGGHFSLETIVLEQFPTFSVFWMLVSSQLHFITFIKIIAQVSTICDPVITL